jgi:hypothetical protein
VPAFKKRSSGGKNIISDSVIEHICNAVRVGCYVETAAPYAGIHKSTLHKWMVLGRDQLKERAESESEHETTLYEKLIYSLDLAMAEAEIRDLSNIDTCAMGRDTVYERDENGHLVRTPKGYPIVITQGLTPDWHASAWRLERKNSSRWGRIDKVEQKITSESKPQVIIYIPANGSEAPDETSSQSEAPGMGGDSI